jgi:hypothetical protein
MGGLVCIRPFGKIGGIIGKEYKDSMKNRY